jgi:hypothetical protein
MVALREGGTTWEIDRERGELRGWSHVVDVPFLKPLSMEDAVHGKDDVTIQKAPGVKVRRIAAADFECYTRSDGFQIPYLAVWTMNGKKVES